MNLLIKEIQDLIVLYGNTNNDEKVKISYTISLLLEVFKQFSYDNNFSYFNELSNETNIYLHNIIKKNLMQTNDENYKIILSKTLENAIIYFKNFYLCEKEQKAFFTLQEAKNLIIDFFSNFDESLIPIITKSLDDNHLFISYKSYNLKHYMKYGYTTFNNYTKSMFTFINNYDGIINIDTISCIVHEIGHVINYHINYKFADTISNNLIEIPACTFDILFLKYLIKNNIYVIDSEIQINKFLFYLLYSIISLQEKLYTQPLDNSLYKYVYGYLISILLQLEFQKDFEKTKYNFYEFIKSIGDKDDIFMFNNFGLNIDTIVKCEYLNDEVKRNKKVLNNLKS